MTDPERQVRRTLALALAGNLLLAAAKATYGFATGALALVADGLHSVADAGGSLIGLLSLRVAGRPSDHDHHYGHHKFETLAALAIGGFIALTAWEVGKGAVARLGQGVPPAYHDAGPILVAVAMAFSAALAWYERVVGRRTGSRLLEADAVHTASDVLVSLVVLASLFATRAGLGWADPAISLAIAVYLAWIALRIVRENVLELSDAAFLDPGEIEAVAREVPGVLDCHKARTRGRDGAAFVDLHVQIAPDTDTVTSHRIVHDVYDRIVERIPGVRDVIIHTEPWSGPDDEHRRGAR